MTPMTPMTSSPRELMGVAAAGPMLEVEIISLHDERGKLRVAYEWYDSALSCDPADDSEFSWIVHKLENDLVALSPKLGHEGKTLYVSVRNDHEWYAQVQEPGSHDWITWIRRDEQIRMSGHGLFSVSFQGFNGEYLAVDEHPSSKHGHTAFRLRSIGSVDARSRTWFLGVKSSLQAGLRVPLAHEVTDSDIQRAYAAAGLTLAPEDLARIRARLS
jgi:hypothetical protein